MAGLAGLMNSNSDRGSDFRVMGYGPGVDRPGTYGGNVGAWGTPLEVGRSVAVSPNLLSTYPQGSYVTIGGRTYRVDDTSYYGAGRPTRDTIEIFGGPDMGRQTVSRFNPSPTVARVPNPQRPISGPLPGPRGSDGIGGTPPGALGGNAFGGGTSGGLAGLLPTSGGNRPNPSYTPSGPRGTGGAVGPTNYLGFPNSLGVGYTNLPGEHWIGGGFSHVDPTNGRPVYDALGYFDGNGGGNVAGSGGGGGGGSGYSYSNPGGYGNMGFATGGGGAITSFLQRLARAS